MAIPVANECAGYGVDIRRKAVARLEAGTPATQRKCKTAVCSYLDQLCPQSGTCPGPAVVAGPPQPKISLLDGEGAIERGQRIPHNSCCGAGRFKSQYKLAASGNASQGALRSISCPQRIELHKSEGRARCQAAAPCKEV